MKKIIPIVLSLMFSQMAYSDSAISRESLLGLERTTVDRIRDAGVFGDRDEIRNKAIRDRGFQMGAQYGYIKGIQVIQDKLEKMSDEIDRLYNFSYLMSMSSDSSAEMYLIPPTVDEYSNIKALDHESSSLTIIENKYVITSPARLVTSPLDWRQYLKFLPRAEEVQIAESLLPQNDREKAIWRKSVNEGWHEGSQMAEREMLSRIEALVRDFGGIIRFNRLADEGYFTRPMLVETRIPVTGNRNEVIQNKTIYTIVAESSANLDESDWEARVLDNRESMIFPREYGGVDIEVTTR